MKIISTLCFLFVFSHFCEAGINPTFNLTAKNFKRYPGQNSQDSIITFEIYMQQTNQGQPGVDDFEYAAGQFTFGYNKAIHSPGGNLVLSLDTAGSDLPPSLRPPTFKVDSLEGFLRSSGNLPNSLENYFISGSFPGSRILTFKVRTNNTAFNMVPLNLRFKLGAPPTTLIARLLPYPDSVDSEQFPDQFAFLLTDTVNNHYSIDTNTNEGGIILLSPGYNSTIVKKYIDFSWNKVAEANSYLIQIATDANFNNIVISQSLTDTTITVGTLIAHNSYYWRISARNDSAYFLNSSVWVFNTNTIQTILNYPHNNDSNVSLPVTFSWYNSGFSYMDESVNLGSVFENDFFDFNYKVDTKSKIRSNIFINAGVNNITYKLEVADDQSFSNIVFSDSAIVDSFKTVNNLVFNTDYYWRVTPVNDSVFTEASEVWGFNTNVPPIVLISPADVSSISERYIDFTWDPSSYAESYRLQISTDSTFNNIVYNDSTLTTTAATVSSLSANTSYYWRVSGKNNSVYTTHSPVRSFHTLALRVVLIYPLNVSLFVPLPVTFSWQKADFDSSPVMNFESQRSGNPVYDRIAGTEGKKISGNITNAGLFNILYKLEVASDPAMSNIVFSDSSIIDSFKTVNSLELNRDYYWRVTPVNDSIFTEDSPVWSFNTDELPIELYSPANNSITAREFIDFSWSKSITAISYKLEISTDVNFNNIVFNDSTLTDTAATISSLSPNTTYYWRVSGKNDSEYVTQSIVWTFGIVPVPVILSYPPEDAISVALPVTFSWYKSDFDSSPGTSNLLNEEKDNVVFNKKTNRQENIKPVVFISDNGAAGEIYKLEVATDQNFTNIVFSDPSIIDSFKTVGSLLPNTKYYWKVTPNNDSVFYISSEIRKFNTNLPVILNSPPDNSISIPTPVNFTWLSMDSTVYYTLQVSTDSLLNNIIVNDSSITDTFKTISGLNDFRNYYWRIKAKLSSDVILFSDVWHFRTQGIQDTYPTFNMTVKNISTTNPSGPRDSIMVFEVWLQQTNQGMPGVFDFEYGAGQFTFSYNKAIHSGGNLVMGIIPSGSALPPALRPPTFQVDSVNGYLKASGNLPNSLENFFISGTFPGTRILTFRLVTNNPYFNQVPLNLKFKLGASPNTFPAFFLPYPPSVDSTQFPNQPLAPLFDTVNNHYTVENGGYVLPVELSSFTSGVSRDMVSLNWSTSSEINNAGFDIERSAVNGEWIKAGNVTGSGSTTETRNYSFSERINTGKYNYRLKQIDYNGSFEYFNLSNEVEVGVPDQYSLSQNYPNPFNPTTKIDYELPVDGNTSVIIYDISGKEVTRLVNEFETAGYYTIGLNASSLASGIYFYMIRSKDFSMTKRMMVIK